MKLEGWIAVINDGWIGDDDKEELEIRLREYGRNFPIYRIEIEMNPTVEAITIPDGEETPQERRERQLDEYDPIGDYEAQQFNKESP